MYRLMGLGVNALGVPSNLDEFKKVASLNTGNLLFNHASLLIANVQEGKYSWGTDAAVINRDGHGVLIPMANHLGSHVDLSVSGPRISDLEVPVVVLGLGAQFEDENCDVGAIPRGTIDWVRMAIAKGISGNVSLRGKITHSVVTALGLAEGTEVLGCPSLLINGDPSLGSQIARKFRASGPAQKTSSLAIAAGNPFKRHLAKLERSLINLVDVHASMYIVQHPRQLIALSCAWSEGGQDLGVLGRWFPGSTPEGIADWFRKRTTVYISVPQWILDLSKREFCIGTRIHGVQAAIQAGTPAVCLYIDTRTKELCEYMRIPCVAASRVMADFRLDDLYELVGQWDWDEFDRNRCEVARRTASFLERNEVPVSHHLKRLCLN